MDKKLAVITGATKGIGRALVDAFSEENFDVFICARNEHDLQQVKVESEKKYHNKIYYSVCDVADKNSRTHFISKVKEVKDDPDVLINNAGVFIPGQINEEEEGVLENMINTNLISAYHITRGFLPGMIREKKGHIFNMCSTASIMAYVNGGSYCITKHALLGFSKVLREEMKPYEIRVTSVLPGATFTASWEGTDLPEERFMKPEDVAYSILNCYRMSSRTVVEELLLRPQLGDL
ncbi:MAG: SDR family oxidoreductase [Candidatus Cyclobacteriaceae bacterium M2_1C_046]